MQVKGNMSKSIMLAGIPLLAFPFLVEAGMSRDSSNRHESQRSFSNEQIVQGEIFRKDGNQITLRTSDGERISFRIEDRTNQLCPEGTATKTSQSSQDSSMVQGSTTGSSSSGGQSSSMGQGSSGQHGSSMGQSPSGDQHSSMSTSEQGHQPKGANLSASQSSQSGQSSQKAGFMFGDCNFQNGDYVKAKVDQNGIATFVRSMGYSEGEEFSEGRMGDDYFVLPAGQLGGLDISDTDDHYTVKSSDGEEIGHVHKVMTSSQGDLSYAIIRQKDGQLISVPWQALEGAGNKSFKLKVTKNQLGSLPTLQQGDNAVQHVQKQWDLTQREQQELAQWNDRMDRFYANRDRYYEDTPTFHGNREGYSRYGQRQSSTYDYDYDDRTRNERYPILGSRPGVAGERGSVSIFGSPSTLPPSEHAPQYEGADREGSSDRYSGDRRNRQSRYSDEDRNRSNRHSRNQRFGFSPSEFSPPANAPQYEGDDRHRSFDRNRRAQNQPYEEPLYRNFRSGNDRSRQSFDRRQSFDQDWQGKNSDRFQDQEDRFRTRDNQGRDMFSQSREGKGDDNERYQNRRGERGQNYDYRPEPYRP